MFVINDFKTSHQKVNCSQLKSDMLFLIYFYSLNFNVTKVIMQVNVSLLFLNQTVLSQGLSDVATILARRVAVEFSDSDDGPSDSEYDSDDWG